MNETETTVINFYSANDEYGCFSNFAPYPISMEGKIWPTSEHYFQAQKFENTEYQEKIRQTASAMIAARLGRSNRQVLLRADWESIKVGIMTDAVRAKFMQHDKIRRILLSTGSAMLVEHTKNDAYWGDGGDGNGKNMLGQILMKIRQELQAK